MVPEQDLNQGLSNRCIVEREFECRFIAAMNGQNTWATGCERLNYFALGVRTWHGHFENTSYIKIEIEKCLERIVKLERSINFQCKYFPRICLVRVCPCVLNHGYVTYINALIFNREINYACGRKVLSQP